MQRAIDETNRHREKQIKYNMEHNIVPKQISKSIDAILGQTAVVDMVEKQAETKVSAKPYKIEESPNDIALASEPVLTYKSKKEIEKAIRTAHQNMQRAVKELDFMNAAKYRDEITKLKNILEKDK